MIKDLVSDFVRQAPPYNFGLGEPVKSLRPGITEIYEMNKNENPFGISPLAAAEMKKQVDISNRYPDIKAAGLCKKLAALHGLKPENVLVTQGATSALGFIGEILIREGVEAIVTSPTYPNYYNIIKKNRGTLVDIPMGDDYVPDFKAISDAITDKTRVIFLCNPNNPTGTICKDTDLIDFMNSLPSHVVLVVDEAYFDFIEDPSYKSMISQIADDRNLIVIRTFSKIYGMAGARIGYILSNPEIIGYLGITATGFCCNRVGLLGAEAALDDQGFIKMTIENNRKCREYLTKEMEDMGFRVWPSSSNFIFFKPSIPPREFAAELMSFGIHIRGDFAQARISIGTMQQCQTAAAAMKQILKEYQEKA